MRIKEKRSSVQKCPQIFVVILRCSTNSQVKAKKIIIIKRSSSQKFHEIRCESTKATKKQFLLANSRTISTNLRVLDFNLHSSSPKPANFFGAQSSLGKAQAVIWEGHGSGMPPRGARPGLMGARGWFHRLNASSFGFHLAEGDSVERSDCNASQGTFCFQFSIVFQFYRYIPFTDVESSRTHFEVLGLEASSP